MKKLTSLLLTVALFLAAGAVTSQAAVLTWFDNFNSYGTGELVGSGAPYIGNNGGAFVLTSSVGISSSIGVASVGTNNRQVLYTGGNGSLATGNITLSAFFSPTAVGSGQLFEMALYPDGVTAPGSQNRTGMRVVTGAGTDTFQILVNNAGGATSNLASDLVTGQWYQFNLTFSEVTPTTLDMTGSIYNATSAGVVGSLISTATFTNLTSAIAGDSAVYGGFRSSFTGTVDNFAISTVPEPSTFALLGLGALGLAAWRRRRA